MKSQTTEKSDHDVHISEFVRGIFAVDPATVYQHEMVYAGQRGHTEDEALRKLMLAVLENGITCFQKYYLKPSRLNRLLSEEAEEWFNCKDNELFSFENICESLGLDPERLRTKLNRWKFEHVVKGSSRATSTQNPVSAWVRITA